MQTNNFVIDANFKTIGNITLNGVLSGSGSLAREPITPVFKLTLSGDNSGATEAITASGGATLGGTPIPPVQRPCGIGNAPALAGHPPCGA